MALRKIVIIDEEKCDGCGDCIINCPEGALAIVDGKARIVRDSYCDGLGACIGACPLGAITLEEREADPFDAEAVAARMEAAEPRGCPGSAAKLQNCLPVMGEAASSPAPAASSPPHTSTVPSQLSHWPVQLSLVAPDAVFLHEADLLLAADCVPFAMADFHRQFLHERPVVIGCPKLDDASSYAQKLASIFTNARPKKLTIIRMEVPCCSGLCRIVKRAMEQSESSVPVEDITVSTTGAVIDKKIW